MTEFSDKVTVYHKAGKFDFSNRILPSGISEVKVVKVLKTRESQYGDSTIQLLADNGAVIVSFDGSPRDKAEKLLSVIARKGFALLRFHKTKDSQLTPPRKGVGLALEIALQTIGLLTYPAHQV